MRSSALLAFAAILATTPALAGVPEDQPAVTVLRGSSAPPVPQASLPAQKIIEYREVVSPPIYYPVLLLRRMTHHHR